MFRFFSSYFHTIKHLKFIQIRSRILRRFNNVTFKTPEITLNERVETEWVAFPLSKSCYKGYGQFEFLNVIDTISDWNDEGKSKLWLYNLHYFDDLNQSEWQERAEIHRRLINSWIEQNPKMVGNGWEPYTLSLRTVNWIKWFLSGSRTKTEWLSSLSLQVQALDQQLEYHLLGNHLFANAKGLVFAGCFFSGEISATWLQRGLDILNKEVPEQIMADGASFELTPMYHNTLLADMLDLYQLSLVYPDCIPSRTSKYWKGLISQMLSWADSMAHPDGEVSFFNDSAIGIAPKLSTLRKYALEIGIELPLTNQNRITHLKDSGYIIIQDDINKLIIDVAKVGPDYIPGHAHADTLSFELSIEGHRVFVNSGTSVYGLDEERLRQRKTTSHNTVTVDEMDSSEVWGGFRVAKRAYPSTPIINETDNKVWIECSHNGYMRLPGKVTHTRQWQIEDNVIAINDKLSGRFSSAQAHYHLHPDIVLEECGTSGSIVFTLPNGAQYSICVIGGNLTVVDSTWHPEFGLSIPNKKLILSFEKDDVKFFLKRA